MDYSRGWNVCVTHGMDEPHGMGQQPTEYGKTHEHGNTNGYNDTHEIRDRRNTPINTPIKLNRSAVIGSQPWVKPTDTTEPITLCTCGTCSIVWSPLRGCWMLGGLYVPLGMTMPWDYWSVGFNRSMGFTCSVGYTYVPPTAVIQSPLRGFDRRTP